MKTLYSELCVLRKMPWHGAFARDYQSSSWRAWFGMAILIVSSFVSEDTVNTYRDEALDVVNQSSKNDRTVDILPER